MGIKVIEVFLSIFFAGTAFGFAAGYMVRAGISQRRRARAKRNRMIL
jgi:hypothetical protein